MPLLSLDPTQLTASANANSALPTLVAVSSALAPVAAVSTAAFTTQVKTVTVLEIVYLAAPTTTASPSPSSTAALASGSGSASAAASNLASFATDSYDGMSFMQLGATVSSVLLVVIVVACFAAIFLRQAGQMRRLLEATDEEELSDVGLGGAGRRTVKRPVKRGRRRGERRGLMARQADSTSDRHGSSSMSDSSDSSDGDKHVKP
ncbi:hypothetical protein DMC30DRAFT_235668 [Rhodotorula diobovata]|uniref:Uncharacterized protein n=1 Tax=Rhodotorula diobovata TaxID=5288 RepID=A0A5C5FVB2_9BASI|nr:hypothetical protein DMC30DRAFT_235668 [Rhodotorula diobovata]